MRLMNESWYKLVQQSLCQQTLSDVFVIDASHTTIVLSMSLAVPPLTIELNASSKLASSEVSLEI